MPRLTPFRILKALVASALSVLNSLPAAALDKSGYTLFHPTPRELMRKLSTDRPDKTESPYTVDAGHFQFETDLWIAGQDKNSDGSQSHKFALNVINLKAGLLNDVDFQAAIESYLELTEVDSSGIETRKKGFGDTVFRLKKNFIGNDGGPLSLGVMPLVKFATNSGGLRNKKLEGGVILPVAFELPGGYDVGLMPQVIKAVNSDDEHYHTEYVTSFSVARDLIGPLQGYMEFFSLSSNEQGVPWLATGDVGFTCMIGEYWQADAGVNFGLTDSADDYQPFIGISARF